ncbi:MAG TPA: hypothetical protein VFZ64_15315 [Nocardioidaceae bacterium]
MTTWDPGIGGHEVLTFGGEPSPRRPLRQLTAVAAAGLVLGFLAGGRAEPAPVASAPADQVQLAAGSIGALPNGGRPGWSRPAPGWSFEVPIHNGTGDDVTVTVVAIPDWDVPIERSAEVEITAGSWEDVRFTPSVECSIPPFTVRSITVLARSSTGTRRTELPLATPTTAMQDYHLVGCTPASTLTRTQLAGVWILDDTGGGDASWLAGRLLIRFGRDGSFVWDAEGKLLKTLPAGRGRYVTQEDQLRLRLTGGVGCRPGDSFAWWTTVLPDHRLHLELDRSAGSCAGRPGEVWVLRRLLRDSDRLPR